MSHRVLVVLLAGASGVGKTERSYALARHLNAALVEVDDLVVGVQALTDASEQPALHYWLQHDSAALPVDEVAERQADFAVAMGPAINAVVQNHLSTGWPANRNSARPRPGQSGLRPFAH